MNVGVNVPDSTLVLVISPQSRFPSISTDSNISKGLALVVNESQLIVVVAIDVQLIAAIPLKVVVAVGSPSTIADPLPS